jgi:hypothetical protein
MYGYRLQKNYKKYMAWFNSTGKENHTSLFDNVEFDRCIFCRGITFYFNKEEYELV